MPTAAFNTGLRIAIEDVGGTAPGGSTNPNWWQGGRWIGLTTEGFPSIQNRQAIIFPSGAAGNRNINTRGPALGRRWTDGGFAFPITQDFLGALFYAALGTLSTNEVPAASPTIASGTPLISAQTVTVDKSANPVDGGVILRFRITAGSAANIKGGTISISGIDANGRGASESISIASAGSYYSRVSYQAIGPSSITINSDGDGTAQVTAVHYWEHTFSAGPSNPTMSLERIGDPTAGAASISFMHTSMVVTDLTLNIPAEQRDGLMTGNVSLEGAFGATCTAASHVAPSATAVWPSWGMSATRDSGTWNRLTNATLTIAAGNRNYRSAAGVQNPQGSFFGPREVTGSVDLIVDNEEEYNRFIGASAHQMVWNLDTPNKLNRWQNQAMSLSMLSTYLESIDVTEGDDMFMLSADFRTVEDSAANVLQVRLTCGVPGIAYGGTVD